MLKGYSPTYRYLITTISLCVLVALVTALMIETHFFSQQAQEMLHLKEEYAGYVQGLRRVISEYHAREQGDAGLKKKSVTDSTTSFVTVNRDPSYLHNAAQAYARHHGLVQTITHEQLENGRIRKKKRSSRRQRQVVQKLQRTVSFDADLELLRKEYTFLCPLPTGTFRVSSLFGPRSLRGRRDFHYGLDLAAPYNTPVKAVSHGMIIEVRRGVKGFGNTVLMSHPNKTGKCKLTTRYAHLSRIDERVKVGDMIEQGHIIGRVGNTGRVHGRNGMHLHLEVSVYGKRVDPLYFFQHLRSMK